jgi:hypothetical protein
VPKPNQETSKLRMIALDGTHAQGSLKKPWPLNFFG